MYGLPGSAVQFAAHRAKLRAGRPSRLSKFIAAQGDLFLAERLISANRLPARNEVRTASRVAEIEAAEAKKEIRAGGSTPYQSGLADSATNGR